MKNIGQEPARPGDGGHDGEDDDAPKLFKLTSPAKLAIEGRSAGGMLMGVVINMRSDLFKVA